MEKEKILQIIRELSEKKGKKRVKKEQILNLVTAIIGLISAIMNLLVLLKN